MDLIPYIYHETQQGQLCAQHAINNLLQQPLYTATELAEIAQNIDIQESQISQINTTISSNYDDSGYFSIQVIAAALAIFNLELISLASRDVRVLEVQEQATNAQAFICNLDNHWFTIRKFGGRKTRFYNLNSMGAIQYLTETYLEIFLRQLTDEGYSIFCVWGSLPNSEADLKALELGDVKELPAVPAVSQRVELEMDEDMKRAIAESLAYGDDPSIRRAIAASLQDNGVQPYEQDNDLQKALNMSMRMDDPQLDNEPVDQQQIKLAVKNSMYDMNELNLPDEVPGTLGEEHDMIQLAIKNSISDFHGDTKDVGVDKHIRNFNLGLVGNISNDIKSSSNGPSADELEEMRKKRLQRFSK